MEALFKLIRNVKALDTNRVFERFMDKDNAKVYMLNLNRFDQLYEQGIDANGKFLGTYTEHTKQLKRDPMLTHITLRETGEFYNSFRVTTGYGYAEIQADPIKDQGTEFGDLTLRFGPDIIGLTDDSKEAMGEFILNNGVHEQILDEIHNY